MCGILGIITPRGTCANITRDAFEQVRDTLSHRGPDSAGTWQRHNVLLGHRRLAVIDTSSTGNQPRVSADDDSLHPSLALVYNGEIYNHLALRQQINAQTTRDHDSPGPHFISTSDTETLFHLLRLHREHTPNLLRGMYAFAAYFAREHELVLARDPMGVKPIYYALVNSGNVEHFCFASELQAIEKLLLALGIASEPDMVTVSAYMTTIRTTLGSRTLLRNISIVQPGETLTVDVSGPSVHVRRTQQSTIHPDEPSGTRDITQRVRAAIIDSVRSHMMSDVPVCTLLSGGLDSAIIASIARTPLSFCAGSQEAGSHSPDFAFAREAAALHAMEHREAIVTREMFREQWPAMVRHNAQPLSTPNEVAIFHVARTLRAAGCVVTLSGEGADELFGGYDLALLQARRAWQTGLIRTFEDAGEYELDANAWIGRTLKPQLLYPDAVRAMEHDAALTQFYRETFAAVARARDNDDPLQAHLRWQRTINLTGLLQRLDTATMRAGVEGRTPFADAHVMRLAEHLPIDRKLQLRQDSVTTKAVLREAFADDVLASILRRPKASFPLPFQAWIADHTSALHDSRFIREIVQPAALAHVQRDPAASWHLAWPLINLAMWRA
jgi:asparagine synthase (glutamine-hydrolysing)